MENAEDQGQSQLKTFLNKKIDTTSWKTILSALEKNPSWAYVAYARDDDGEPTALSYRWDNAANEYCASEDWDRCLKQLQEKGYFELRKHAHTARLREYVDQHKKLWVDQHCIPQVEGRMGCVKPAGVLYHGKVTSILTNRMVDAAFTNGEGHNLLGYLEEWMGRGWVQQEITARGKLVNLPSFEYFFEKAKASGDDRLIGGSESLCVLLRRMKGAAEEPFADRVVRFYAVMESDFTVESDREINIPDFSDKGYEVYPVDKQPEGYVLQPGVTVSNGRVYMRDANGANVGKWCKAKALYMKAKGTPDDKVECD